MKKKCEFSGHSELIKFIKFNYDGNCLASLSYDYTIRLWSLEERRELVCFSFSALEKYKALGFNPEGKLFVAGILTRPPGLRPYKFVITDITKKKIIASVNLERKGYPFALYKPESIAFNPQCTLVAAIYSCDDVLKYKGGDILLWQLNKKLFGYRLKEVGNMCGKVSHYRFPLLAFSPEGDILVTTQPIMVKNFVRDEWVGIAEFWNVQTKKLVDMIEIPNLLGIHSIHFSLDGNVFLGTELSGLKSFQLWDKKRNRVITIEHSAEVLSSAISPDGRFLATGDIAGTIKLSSIPEGNEIAAIQADTQRYGVSCISFGPDGKTIAFAADKIEVWELS